MIESDTPLTQYEGYVFKELHEQWPEMADDLQGLIEARRAEGRCDLCGAPLPTAPEGQAVVAAHIVGISICPACRARHASSS